MAIFLGHWALRGYGLWAIEERDSGAHVRELGGLDPVDPMG